jgi:MFS family permease
MNGRKLLVDSRLYPILAMTAVGVLGATIVSPTLPGIAEAFDLTDSRVALVMTAFFLPAAISLPIVGALADSHGRRPMALWALMIYGIAGVAIAVAPTFEVLLVLRAIQGVAFPGLIPLSIVIIGDVYDGPTATQVQGYRSSINGLTGVIFPSIAGALVGFSWRLPYWLYGVSFFTLLLCFLYLPQTVERSTDTETTRLVEQLHRQQIVGSVREVKRTLSPPLLAVIGATFTIFLVRYALLTFVPLYVVGQLGWQEALGGLAVAAMGLGRFVGGPLAGTVVDRFSRRSTLLGAQLTFVGGTTLLAFAPSRGTLLLSVTVVSLGEGLFNPVANDFVTASISGEVRARIVSILEIGKTIAIAVSPVAFGVVLEASSYRVSFLVGAAAVISVALLVHSGYGQGGRGHINEDLPEN